jgi:hypothetical protein
VFARLDELAGGGDHVGRQQVVDRQAVAPAQPAEATAEGEPGHARRRVDAQRRGKPESLRLLVELAQRHPGLDARRAPGRIHAHRFHLREVDLQAPLAHRIARDVVAAAAHGQQQVVVAGETHGADDVRGPRASHGERGPPVDHGVPDRPCLLVVFRSGNGETAAQALLERGEFLVIELRGCGRARVQFGHGCLLGLSIRSKWGNQPRRRALRFQIASARRNGIPGTCFSS